MSEIIEVPFDYSLISLSAESDRVRSPGLHLTDITKDMLFTSGINRAGGKPFNPEDQHLLFEQGFLWERMIERMLESQMERDIGRSDGILNRPGEFSMDGVFATPDAINTEYYHLEEWKATAVRRAKFDVRTHRPEWIWQAGFYCKYFEMDTVYFRIWHYCEMPPQVTQLKVIFGPNELNENRDRILNHARWKGWLI